MTNQATATRAMLTRFSVRLERACSSDVTRYEMAIAMMINLCDSTKTANQRLTLRTTSEQHALLHAFPYNS